jgi:hypothetical protein
VVYRSSPRYFVDRRPIVYRTPPEDAYWSGVTTGRVEAVAVAATALYAYNKVSEMLDGEGESSGGWGGENRRGGRSDADGIRTYDATGSYGEGGVDFSRELEETRTLMRELRSELQASEPLARAIDQPIDGTYTGASAEDDDGDQDVLTTLSFGLDGSITGEGYDGVDGSYRIREGQWSHKRVAWIESYDEGFSVALRGQLRPDGTIVALWASSRGVGGSVSLKRPDP